MHGRWMEWFENGVTFQGHYRKGKKHGEWWEWYENGRLAVEANFLNGFALDLKVWRPDGKVCEQSWVSSGYGQWIRYGLDGEIRGRHEISNGEIGFDEEDSGGMVTTESWKLEVVPWPGLSKRLPRLASGLGQKP